MQAYQTAQHHARALERQSDIWRIIVLVRLDLWGELIDLLGLTVLLSYDVRALKPLLNVLMRFRQPQRIQTLISRLHPKIVDFMKSFPPAMVPNRLETLRGKDALAFLNMLPNWQRGQNAPESLDVCAVSLDPLYTRGEPWIYAGQASSKLPNAADPPIAGPVPSSALFDSWKKEIQNFVYTTGFLLMAVGSILVIVQITLSPR